MNALKTLLRLARFASLFALAGASVAGCLGTGSREEGSPDTSDRGGSTDGFGAIVSKEMYEAMFPNRDALYSYDDLIAATRDFPAFCNEGSDGDRRREAAAFLANISHETTGGWPTAPGGPFAWGLVFTQEVGCEMGTCTSYCDASNTQFPCAPGKTYHGRGPIQLSWNYNYGAVGQQLGIDLLHDPDLVTSSGVVAFKTGLWFWMTPQAPKPSSHDVMVGRWVPSVEDQAAGRTPGFGLTINIINGGIECGKVTPSQVEDRVGFYKAFTGVLSVDPGQNLYCDTMQHF
jgi:chitinase